jgi:hypothetical protein
VPIILLMANRVNAWPRSLVKMCGRLGTCSRLARTSLRHTTGTMQANGGMDACG